MSFAPVSQKTLDDAAFSALLERSRAAVLRFLQRLCASEAEDLLQETLAKVWRLRASYDGRGKIESWLMQAAFRTFCDHRARVRVRATTDASVDEVEAPTPACSLELRDEVAARLQTLTPIQRDLLTAFHGHGASLDELAARHGLPRNTVKSHLHRARARLQENGGNDDAR